MKQTKTKKAAKPVAKKKAPLAKPAQDSSALTKKLATQARKLAKQRKVVAAADAAAPAKTKKRGKAADPSAPAKPTEPDAPRIDCRLLTNDFSVPIDPNHVIGLERTVGAGEYGHGRGLIDKWPDGAWVSLLTYLGLPADPLDRTVAAQPVKRLVQRLWYDAINGGVPEDSRSTFDKRDQERQEEYENGFDAVKEAVETKIERAKTSLAASRGERRSEYAGKKIKVLNKNHGARPGSKRAIGMDIIIASKTSDEALPKLKAAGCNASFIAFAISSGFVELA